MDTTITDPVIRKRDFDAATRGEWRPMTCLVAQVMIRNGITPSSKPSGENPLYFAHEHGLRRLQQEFDANFNRPRDVNSLEMQALRASLPD